MVNHFHTLTTSAFGLTTGWWPAHFQAAWPAIHACTREERSFTCYFSKKGKKYFQENKAEGGIKSYKRPFWVTHGQETHSDAGWSRHDGSVVVALVNRLQLLQQSLLSDPAMSRRTTSFHIIAIIGLCHSIIVMYAWHLQLPSFWNPKMPSSIINSMQRSEYSLKLKKAGDDWEVRNG